MKRKTKAQTSAETSNLISYLTGALMSTETVAIRREVLARDGDCCVFCKAPGGASVLRGSKGSEEYYVLLDTRMAHDADTGRLLGRVSADELPINRSTRIVLDLFYLDGNPANVGRKGKRPNVVTACQRCNSAAGMKAIEAATQARQDAAAKAEQERRDAERIAEFGPMLPLNFG